jgi:tripartite-type tricarboxylate transporter receptor subunit TctC
MAQYANADSKYPDRSVRIIVGFPPGTAPDVSARILANKFTEHWGVPVVVENLTGAGSNIATERVAKSAPDGYTLLMGGNPSLVISPSLYEKLPYDPIKDFALISQVFVAANILTVHPDVPAKSIQELVALAKAQPGKLFYASSGNGSAQHLAAELFKLRTGTDIGHVPYKGGGPAVADVAAGHVPFYFGNMSAALPQARAGRVRALAVTSAERSPAAPDVPTIAEAGVKDCEISEWNALLAPAGTPPAVIARLHAEMAKIMRMDDIKAKFADLGADAIGSTPQEFATFLRAEMTKWAEVVTAANIRIE